MDELDEGWTAEDDLAVEATALGDRAAEVIISTFTRWMREDLGAALNVIAPLLTAEQMAVVLGSVADLLEKNAAVLRGQIEEMEA